MPNMTADAIEAWKNNVDSDINRLVKDLGELTSVLDDMRSFVLVKDNNGQVVESNLSIQYRDFAQQNTSATNKLIQFQKDLMGDLTQFITDSRAAEAQAYEKMIEAQDPFAENAALLDDL